MNVFELEATLELDSSPYEKALEEGENKAKEFEAAIGKMGDEADSTRSDINQLGNEVKESASAMDEGGDSSEDWSKKIGDAVLKANLLTSAIEIGIGFLKDFASAVWNLDEATEELRVNMGKLATAFETAGYNGKTAQTAFTGLYAILGETDRATEASQLLAKLATNAQDVSTWVRIATGVTGTFGDSLPIESLIEAANETAKVGQVTGVLADALNWAGILEDDFNAKLAACATTSERTALITSTLAAEYESAADAFERNNETVIKNREAQLRLQQAQAKVGEQTAKLKTALLSGAMPALEKVFGATEKLVGGIAKVAEAWADWVSDIEHPIKTDNLEEARIELANMKAELDGLLKSDNVDAYYADGTISRLSTQIANAEVQVNALSESYEDNAAAANEMAEAAERVIIAGYDLTEVLSATGISAEEAGSRFATYTDAATNMFSRISTESEISYADAIANLEANIQATNDFATNMASITAVLPPKLAEMFAAGGPAMYAGVVSMLAEANAGTDVGLEQFNTLMEEGATAGGQAFLAALTGSIPEGAETPATIITDQMNADTSMEQAGAEVVDRTAEAFNSAVEEAGFNTAGETAMTKFAEGMENMRGFVAEVAGSIANQAAAILQQTMESLSAASATVAGAGGYHAGGLDYVPYNGYPAVLHAGEAVLTRGEAENWRKGGAGNRAAATGQPTVLEIHITNEMDGAVVASKIFRHIVKQEEYHGTPLIKTS